MAQEQVAEHTSMSESSNPQAHFVIVKNWDKSVATLQERAELVGLVSQIGFDLQTLATTATREFQNGLPVHAEHNAGGKKTEDVVVETITVNGRPLDRLLVIAYPPAANKTPTAMTRFISGGEVIFVISGEAEITFAPNATKESISKSDLRSERVGKGDLIISTDTPNNWTIVDGEQFTFVYFVGNPSGLQRYADIPKERVPVIY